MAEGEERPKDAAAEKTNGLKILGEISVGAGSASDAFLKHFGLDCLAIENEGTPHERSIWDKGFETLVRSSKEEPLMPGLIRVYELQEDMTGDAIAAMLPAAPQVSLTHIANLLERRAAGEPIPLHTGGHANLFIVDSGTSQMIVHAFYNLHAEERHWRFELMPLSLKARWQKGVRVFARVQE